MIEKKFASLIFVSCIHVASLTALVAQSTETTATDVMTTEITATDVTTTIPQAVEETTATIQQDALITQSAAPPSTAQADSHTTQAAEADAATSVTLPGGTIYQVLKQGSGAEASTTGTRLIHYTLFLTDGRKLESSRDAEFPVPFSFAPGEGQAIKGMEAGTNGMRVGEVRKLYVPADQAYGEQAHGNVPPNSPLIFTLELVDVK